MLRRQFRQARDGRFQRLTDVLAGVGAQRHVILVAHRTGALQRAQHHLRVLGEVAVDFDRGAAERVGNFRRIHPRHLLDVTSRQPAVLLAVGFRPLPSHHAGARRILDPCRGLLHALGVLLGTLPQKQDVRHHLGAGILLEGAVGQADCAQQFRLLGQHAPGLSVLGVHQVARHHHDLQAARLHGVHRRHEELIVNRHPVDVFAVREVERLAAKWRVADGEVKAVRLKRNILKAGVQNGRLRIECAGDARSDAVVFDADEPSLALQLRRGQADEVANTDGRLQHDAAGKAQALRSFPHGVHHRLCRVVRIHR